MSANSEISAIFAKAKFLYSLWQGDGFSLTDCGSSMWRRVIYYSVDGEERQMPMMGRAHAGLGRFDLHMFFPERMSLTVVYDITFTNPMRIWESASVISTHIVSADIHIFQKEKWEDFEYDFLMAALGEMVIEIG